MHTFLRIPRRVDIPGPLESEFPILPILYVVHMFFWLTRVGKLNPHTFCRYRSPAGPRPFSNTPDDPAGISLNSLAPVVSCSLTSKQLIFVTSHMATLSSATRTWGRSLESGTVVRSAPRTFVQVVRSSMRTTALTLSLFSRLLSMSGRSGELSYTPANPR